MIVQSLCDKQSTAELVIRERYLRNLNAAHDVGHPLALDRNAPNSESRVSEHYGTPSMRALAELSFDFVWHLMFTDDDQLDQDLAVRSLENLSEHFSAMTDEEKRAFIAVAHERKARLFAVPDTDGYSPIRLVTEDQAQFLDHVVSGQFFQQFEEPLAFDTNDCVVPIRSR
ncbi:hypothetical protein BKM03_14290 [Pseudomonas avellanae]|uniref:Uncharacterized protein n=1 Tax=Pseudomonas avellanae TaxID=46257 RepID=A0AAD0DYD3_9PSED|nr:hypothetical protein BKM03_14290 [Pseudomonas avellanae]POP85258.1 hypothetical protein CXB34_17730 [Pseudomonas amygdali pv. morsprunorum]